jgi:hypothetical protein
MPGGSSEFEPFLGGPDVAGVPALFMAEVAKITAAVVDELEAVQVPAGATRPGGQDAASA